MSKSHLSLTDIIHTMRKLLDEITTDLENLAKATKLRHNACAPELSS